MILWGLVSNIFWALVIAIMMWIVCAFSGKLVNSSFRMSMLLHFLCFLITVPTIVLLVAVFSCTKLNRKVEQVQDGIVNLLMADEKFVDQFQREISQAVTTADTRRITEYLADNFSERIFSEYPMLRKYLDKKKILQITDFGKQLSRLSQSSDSGNTGTEKVQQFLHAAVSSFTNGIRSKIISVRRYMVIAVVVLQVIPFGVVFYRASRYRNPIKSNYQYEPNDYL